MECHKADKENVDYEQFLQRLSVTSQELITRSPIAKAIMKRDPNKHFPQSSLATKERKVLAPIQQETQDEVFYTSKMSHNQSALSTGTSCLSQDRSSSSCEQKKGRNMREYEEQLKKLTNENFSLKLRIYFLEESLEQRGNSRDKEELTKEYMDLKVETEALKKDLYDKHELVQQASHLLQTLEENHKAKLEELEQKHNGQVAELEGKLLALQKSIEEHPNKSGQEANLTQLCEIAFNPNATPSKSCLNKSGIRKQDDSLQETSTDDRNTSTHSTSFAKNLQEEVAEQAQTITKLEEELQNVNRELEEQEEKMVYLEIELQERDQKLDRAAASLQSYQMTLGMNQAQLDSLHKKLIEVPENSGATSKQVAEYEELLEEKMKEAFDLNQLVTKTEEQLVEQQDINESLRKKLAGAEEEIVQHEKAQEVMKQLASRALFLEEENCKLVKDNERKQEKIKRLIQELADALNMVEESFAREVNNTSCENCAESSTRGEQNVSQIELDAARESLELSKKVSSVRSRRCVKQNLEIRRLTGLLASTVNHESLNKFHCILTDLKADVTTIHQSMQTFMETVCGGLSHAQRITKCANGLRSRLLRSNSAAEELKAQLENLVGLFQELLEGDGNQLLRRLSSSRRESLMKSLDDSKLLSQSIHLDESIVNDSIADLTVNGTLNVSELDATIPGTDVEMVGNRLCKDMESQISVIETLLALISNVRNHHITDSTVSPGQTPPVKLESQKCHNKSFDWGAATDKVVPERLAVSESDVRQSFALSNSILQNNPSRSLPRDLSSTCVADRMDSFSDFPRAHDVSITFLEEENQILQQYISTQDMKIKELTRELSKLMNQPIFTDLEKCVARLRKVLKLPEASSLLHGLEECVKVTQDVASRNEKLQQDLESRPTAQPDNTSSVKKIALLKASHITSEKCFLELKKSYEKCLEENKVLNKAIAHKEQQCKELVEMEKNKCNQLSQKIQAMEKQIAREFSSSSLGSTTEASMSYLDGTNEDGHIGSSYASPAQVLNFDDSETTDCDESLTRSMLGDADICQVPDHTTLIEENTRLRKANDDLSSSLGLTKKSLADALDELHLNRQRKKEQRATIEKHLGQTHRVLRKASGLMNAAQIKSSSEPKKKT